MEPFSRTARRSLRRARVLGVGCLIFLAGCGAAIPTATPQPAAPPAPTTPATAETAAATPTPAAATPTAAAAPSPAAAPPAAVSPGEIYTATNGLFSVPVPTNWQAAEESGVTRLTDPDKAITIALLTVEESDLAAALGGAWKQVDPTFDLEPKDIQEQPSASGVEKTMAAFYDDGDPAHVLAGVAQLHEGVAYVLLMDAQMPALEKRAAQVGIIQSGFTILALQPANLSDLTPQPVSAAITAELEAFIEEQMERATIPGASVAIVQDGSVVYAKGFGVRNADSAEPMTPDTRMMIGSTGKSLTTMLMATLVDDGKMGWDTPVVEILPDFRVKDPELSRQLTVRNLVCACTGVPRRDLEFILNANDLSAEDTVASLATFEFFTDFGEAFQYSNQMVATGGYAAGVAAGGRPDDLAAAYQSALQERVLDPIGMANTTLSFEAVQSGDNYAVPHAMDIAADAAYHTIPLTMERVLLPVAPAGTHWSTVSDMARYMVTELSQGVAPDGTRVVSAASLKETWEPQIPVDATASYGLGWLVGTYKGLPLIHHGGNTLGFTSDFAFLPEAGLGIIVMTNAGRTNHFNESVRTRLFELVFDQEPEAEKVLDFALQQIDKQTAELSGQFSDTLDPAAAEPFVGSYAHADLGGLDLALADGRLTLDFGEFAATARPLAAEDGAENAYLMTDGPFSGTTVRLQRNAADAPEIIFDGGAAKYTFERTP